MKKNKRGSGAKDLSKKTDGDDEESKGFVETIDNEKEKKSVQSRLRIILLSQKIILFSLGGVAVAIFLWMMV